MTDWNMMPVLTNVEFSRLVVEFITENFGSKGMGLSGGPGSAPVAGNGRSGPDSAAAVHVSYVEYQSDHAFTAFLAGLIPSKVVRERDKSLSKVERKWRELVVQKQQPLAPVGDQFTDRQLQIAVDVLANKKGGRE